MANIFNEEVAAYDIESYYMDIICIANLIKNFGAKSVLTDLKISYPDQYREMIYASLEELPK